MWQTAINPVVALELLAHGCVVGDAVSSDPRRSTRSPFLDLLKEYGSPWGMEERTPA